MARKSIQMTRRAAMDYVKRAYGLHPSDGDQFEDQVESTIGSSREEVDEDEPVRSGYERVGGW